MLKPVARAVLVHWLMGNELRGVWGSDSVCDLNASGQRLPWIIRRHPPSLPLKRNSLFIKTADLMKERKNLNETRGKFLRGLLWNTNIAAVSKRLTQLRFHKNCRLDSGFIASYSTLPPALSGAALTVGLHLAKSAEQ